MLFAVEQEQHQHRLFADRGRADMRDHQTTHMVDQPATAGAAEVEAASTPASWRLPTTAV